MEFNDRSKNHSHHASGEISYPKDGVRTSSCVGCGKKIKSVWTDKSKKEVGNWTNWKTGK
jgi:hypothetical protein